MTEIIPLEPDAVNTDEGKSKMVFFSPAIPKV